MGYKWLLSRFDGRIGRARYWLATLIIMGAMVSGLRLLSSACDMQMCIRDSPGRKLILTNGSTDHADKVLERLGLAAHFEAVFDIIAAELEPKPAPQTYAKFLRDHQVDPLKSAMFEDLARNLVVPHRLGMTTVLVVPDGSKEVVREDWELEGRDAAHVDHVTDDLTGFLQKLVA